eukprot:337440-Pyramimonas_sp.AAC.1
MGAFGGAPYGVTKRVRGVPKCVAGTHVITATGAFGAAPYGETCGGVPKSVAGMHVITATGDIGGAPHGAAERVT